MLQPLSFPIKENLTELRKLQKLFPRKYKAIQMLIVIKQKGALSKDVLAVMVGASDRSIQTWRSNYVTGGVKTAVAVKKPLK